MPHDPFERWNHTTHYHQVLLREVPRPCGQALDVGCGEGDFARQLSKQVEHVDAIDEASKVLTCARLLSKDRKNLHFVDADFMTHPFEPSSYHFVSALATLHHLPFSPAIKKMKTILRPGGVLGVIGLYQVRSPIDYLLSTMAIPISRFHRMIRGLGQVNAPIREPKMDFEEIRQQLNTLLPGAILRRHLLWRYSIVWKKPIDP